MAPYFDAGIRFPWTNVNFILQPGLCDFDGLGHFGTCRVNSDTGTCHSPQILVLLYCPFILTLQVTHTASPDGVFERLISRTMFWSYCVATPPVTVLYLVLGLAFVNS